MTNQSPGAARSLTNAPAKKQKKSGCALGILVLLLFAVAIGGTAFYMSAFNSVTLGQAVTVSIPKGSSTKQISKLLAEEGVVRQAFAFGIFAKQKDKETQLKPGEHSFAAGELTLEQVLDELLKSGISKGTRNITILEGQTIQQTAKKLAKDGAVDETAFLEAAATLAIPYQYIPQAKGFNRLEGFLFPETYNISTSWDESKIIQMLLAQFDKTFLPEWHQRAKELDMTVYEVVTLASIIEREALFDSDRSIISGVFHNRLQKPMRLQSCATVQYVLGEQKAVLTNADIAIDDPYNTYKYDGLPPGPIGSPGQSSIKAALYPEETDYLFFLAKPDGHHYFSKTLKEHNQAKKKYIDNQ